MTTENRDMWLIEHWEQRALKAEAALATQSPVPQAEAAEPVAMPSLYPVIQWLENGCDPKEAAKELRLYEDDRLRLSAAAYRANPSGESSPPPPQRQEAAQVEAQKAVDFDDILNDARIEGDQRYTLRSSAMAFLNGAQFALNIARASLARATQAVKVPLTDDDVQLVVNDNAELGVKIGEQFFFLYKGYSLVYESGLHDDDTPMHWRPVFKREFGECCHPINYDNLELIGTVSLDDSDEWKPLPAASIQPTEGERSHD